MSNRSTETGIADNPKTSEQKTLENHRLSNENQVSESNPDKASRVAEQKADTNKLVDSGVLPKVDLVAHHGANNSSAEKKLQDPSEKMALKVASQLSSGIATAASEVAKGAMQEITQHPERVAANVALGAAITAGVALSAPWVGAAALVGGGAYATYELSKNAPNWINQFGTVSDASNHSQQEVHVARAGLRGLGAGAVDVTAGIAGGAAAGALSAGLGAAVETSLTKGLSERVAATLAEKQGVEFAKPVSQLSRELWAHNESSAFAQKAKLSKMFESGGWDIPTFEKDGHLYAREGNHKFLAAKTLGMADSEIPVTFGSERTTIAGAKQQLGLEVDPGSLRIGESAFKGTLPNLSTPSAVDFLDSLRKLRQAQ